MNVHPDPIGFSQSVKTALGDREYGDPACPHPTDVQCPYIVVPTQNVGGRAGYIHSEHVHPGCVSLRQRKRCDGNRARGWLILIYMVIFGCDSAKLI